jgi:hypothetical protein
MLRKSDWPASHQKCRANKAMPNVRELKRTACGFYRDNIEEEFSAKRVSGSATAGKNMLDDLFRKP